MTSLSLPRGPDHADTRWSRLLDAVVVLGAAGAAAAAAWVGAQAGIKGAVAGAGAIALVVALLIVRERQQLLLFGLPVALVVLLHKSFGPSWDEVSSGPISLYVTTFDLLLVVLAVVWVLRPGFAAELWAVLQRPVVWALVAGALLTSVSVLVAGAVPLALAEVLRMAVMLTLFVVVAASLRRSTGVWVVLGGLGLFALGQLVVVVLQWRTGGVLGLDFLGVPTELGERTLDAGQLGRPFGTVIHPVFLGAVLGTIATMALALALFLRPRWQRLVALAFVPVCLAPMVISHIRAAMVAFLLTALAMAVVAVVRGRVELRTLMAVLAAGAVLALPLTPSLISQFRDNFLTDHFSLEVESRVELNEVGLAMFLDHPLLGTGLNNFEQEMGPYQEHGLIFADNPVHNLFLLQAAESGIVGLLGMAVVAAALFALAWRTSRARSDLHAAVGFGFAGVLVFFLLEEQLGFSLRHDVPRSVFWLLAGLVAACSRLAAQPEPATPGDPAWLTAVRRWWTTPIERDSRRGGPAATGSDAAGSNLAGGIRSNGAGATVAVGAERAVAPGRRRTRRPSPRRQRFLLLRRQLRVLFGGLFRRPRRPRPARPPRPPRRRRRAAHAPARPVWARGLTVTLVAVLLAVPLAALGAGSAPELRIVFTARDRGTGAQGIYTANGDGTGVRLVTPDASPQREYAWAAWAYGGSHIVYTIRSGPGTPESIHLMTADGTQSQPLAVNPWRHGQPKVSPDGRRVVFTSVWDEFPETAIYELDLATLQVTNLSARNRTVGASEADPILTEDGRIIFAQSYADGTDAIEPTQVWIMDGDGTDREQVTDDRFYNVDPTMSPDGRWVVSSSYRGPGHPSKGDVDDPFSAKLTDWVLALRHLPTGEELALTDGALCYDRMPHEACAPHEAPAYVPKFSSDGRTIGFVGIRSVNQVCICTIDRISGEETVLVEDPDLAINWFDWIVPGPAPDFTPAMIGSEATDEALLFGGVVGSGDDPTLRISGVDRWDSFAVPLGDGGAPASAAWSPDRQRIAFVGRVPFDPDDAPAHPASADRREHFTLDYLTHAIDPPVLDPDTAEEQVFLLDLTTGTTEQLTDPWTEDPMDGVPAGDARGNVDPSFSPDGRHLLVTNVSGLTSESFLLRIDLDTGAVTNLTSVTSGAMPVADSSAAYSPDGRHIAFVGVEGPDNDLYVMDADGRDVRRLTDDAHLETSPVWTPDGDRLVYTSYRGGELFTLTDETATGDATDDAGPRIPLTGWALVEVELATRDQRVILAPDEPPLFRPRMSPDGTRVAGITVNDPGQPDIAVVELATGDLETVQVTLRTREQFVEWR